MTINWDPLKNMEALQRKINRVIDDAFSSAKDYTEEAGVSDFKPKTDIYEMDAAYMVEMDLPGFTKENVLIEVKDNIITIKGERAETAEADKNQFLRRERIIGKFTRTFTLPITIDSETIKASFKSGVLNVYIQKPEEEKPTTININ